MLGSFFNPDNFLWSTINKIIDLVVLSLVWVLCSVPLVTIGAASAALYYSIVKCVRRGRSHAVREFFHAFKDALGKGILAELIWAAFAFMMLVSDVPLALTFLDTGKIQDTVLFILFVIKLLLLLSVACWFVPLLSRYNQSIFQLLKASLFLMIRRIFATLGSIVLLLVAVLAAVYEPLFLSFVPGIAMLLLSFLQEPGLQSIYDRSEAEGAQDTWYME